jgi:hypothetical protein
VTSKTKHIPCTISNVPVENNSGTKYDATIRALKLEIISMKQNLLDVESRVRDLESQIQVRYHAEIVRIRDLALLYKKQKVLKKEKRLDQKKRGKNYREPTCLVKEKSTQYSAVISNSNDVQERKKMYREAVLQVHPDKFANHPDEVSKRSENLTIKLIDIYQSGDYEELKQIYHYIMSGNAMSTDIIDNTNLPDPQAMLDYLIKKRDNLMIEMNKAKKSRIYEVLTTYDEPHKFIDELAVQFLIRIRQLERRTRSR